MLKAKPRVWPEVARLLDWGFAAGQAGAVPLGRLPEPPGPPETPEAVAAEVRAAASHTRDDDGLGLLVTLEIALAAGLVVFVVVRRRRVVLMRRARRLQEQRGLQG